MNSLHQACTRSYTKWPTRIILVIALTLAVGAAYSNGLAQSENRWFPTERIPQYDQSTWTPLLIADQNRTVHVFASDLLEDSTVRAIVYRQWRVDSGWTKPNDILLPPIKQEARLHGAVLDRAGNFHLAFFSGDENEAHIYYAHAPALLASQAPAWSLPELIGPSAFTFDDAILAIDSQDRLFVLYVGTDEGNGIYMTHSEDGGYTWSEAAAMFLTYATDLVPFDLNFYVDANDTIHLVWAVNNDTGNTDSIYYAQLAANQDVWTEPIQIDYVGSIPAGQPAITAYSGELLLVYHAVSPEGPITRYLRRSSDNGATWSDKVRLFPQVGSNGAVSFVVDGNNMLHMLFGNRVTSDGQIIHGVWHSLWRSGQWTPPTAIVSGAHRIDFDPSIAHAVISQGNVILVTWMTDPPAISRRKGGTWYSYTSLDLPEQPLVALPPPPIRSTPQVTQPAVTATAVVTHTNAVEQMVRGPQVKRVHVETNAGDPGRLLTIALTPVLIMTLLVIWRATNRPE